MKAPRIGALRRRLTVEAPVADVDGMLDYESRGVLWAAMSRTDQATSILMRARADIAVGWRLRDGGRLFEIVALAGGEAGSRFMTCTCREIAP